MQKCLLSIGFTVCLLVSGCGPQAINSNSNLANRNSNSSNSVNSNANSTNTITSVEATEPAEYQATVKLSLEAIGDEQKTSLPTVAANVARKDNSRLMEFTLPTGEKIVYLDKDGVNYLILPNRKQYAELNKESLGFEVRRMLMPEQIVNQVKSTKGVERVGEETVNGRQAVKYSYSASTETQTKAGTVQTESYFLIDKETGLPLRSETVSQSQTGANVQGYKGMRFVTEMTDIKTSADPTLFVLPSDFQKIDSEQVRSQVDLIFNMIASVVGQALKQAQPTPAQ